MVAFEFGPSGFSSREMISVQGDRLSKASGRAAVGERTPGMVV
jgi:hypothetical protein